MKITFSINQYDKDGDVFDDCILLYLDERNIIRFNNLSELQDFANNINNLVIPEIKEITESWEKIRK